MKYPISEKNKSLLRRTREFYGFSQIFFAAYLNISRSHLAMIEVNERNGTNVDWRPINKFILHMAHAESGKYEGTLPDKILVGTLKKQEEAKIKYATQRLLQVQTTVFFTQRSLDKLKAEQERSTLVLAIVPLLKENPIESIENNLINESKMIGYCEDDSRSVQAKTGQDEQFKLELEIVGLKAEIEFLEKFLEKPGRV